MEKLTRMEEKIFRELGGREEQRQIGEALKLSQKTVEKHLSSIFRKPEVTNRKEATVLY